jgi:Tol biopolymer transport system component
MRRFQIVLLAGAAVLTATIPGLARAAPGDTTLVSVRDPAQVTAMGPSLDAKVSGNGRYVAFRSQALDLAPGGTTPRFHGYVRDLVAGTTERVTVASNETVANSDTDSLAISRDGRFVAFGSMASNLVPNDTNNVGDVFVRDRTTGLTERVSVNSSGGQAARASFAPCLSADGRYVAFGSRAPNLVAGDTNAVDDLLIRDRQTAQTRRISITSGGIQANGSSYACNFSVDARFVVFISSATNLVAGDTNAADDVFVRDLVANTTERVSLNSLGAQANQGVPAIRTVAISTDGRFVAFASGSTNLVPGDTNDGTDVFVRDRLASRTERISVTSNGAQTSGGSLSFAPVISSDGRYVAFYSNAANLGPAGAEAGIFVRDRLASTTVRVSVSSNGLPGNRYSAWPSMSADGRYVAFESYASDLVKGDGNGDTDVFVRDRQAATLRAVSRLQVPSDAAGSEDYIRSYDETLRGPSISDDGRFVAFVSTARSLVLPDTFDDTRVYVRDLQTGDTVRLPSRGSLQNDPLISGDGRYVVYTENATLEWDRLTGSTRERMAIHAYHPSISTDGRSLAFVDYSGLVPEDTNGDGDIYVHDRDSGQFERVNVSSDGTQANNFSDWPPDVSGDGGFVTFVSMATNLVTGDANNAPDIFVHDRTTRQTERISVSSGGAQANSDSYSPSISADGRFVAFISYATNLVSGDTNAQADLFVHDRQTHQTTRVLPNGFAVGDSSFSISADGRYLTLATSEPLLAGDTNTARDVFVIGWQTGTIELMSVATAGTQANAGSDLPSMSGNGRIVVFNTHASNLGGKDLNGLTDVYVHERAVSSLTVSPRSLAFGNQLVNSTSPAQTVRVANVSTAAVPITSVALSGANPGQFARTHNCGSSLAAGASCTVSVVFKPTSTGAKSAVLTVNGSGGGLRSVSLTGTGVTISATYTVSPSSLGFGSRAVGTTSPAKIVTVHNTGSVALPLSGITLGGTNPGQFARTTNCGSSLAAGASCTVSVVFKPTSKGAKSATLVVTPGGHAPQKSVALSGTGT